MSGVDTLINLFLQHITKAKSTKNQPTNNFFLRILAYIG